MSATAALPRQRLPLWLAIACAGPFLLVAVPVGYVAVSAAEAGPSGILADLVRPYTLGLLANTLTIATVVALLAGVIGTAAAWCTERTDLPGRRAWRLAVALPLAMPAYVSSFAWSSLGPGFQEIQGAILILTLYSVPMVFLPVAAAMRALDQNREDVARSLGSGNPGVFFRVVLPEIAPALGSGALLVAAHMLSEFGAFAFLRVETFTTAIFDQYTAEFDNQAAALLAGVLLLLTLPVAFGEAWLRSRRRTARLGRGSARTLAKVPLGRWLWPVVLGLVVLEALAFAVPMATLAFWLVRGTSTGHGIGRVVPALYDSLRYALPGAALTTMLAIPLVVATTEFRPRIATILDRLPYAVHGMPGIVVALAAVAVSIRAAPALYQTVPLVMLVYAALMLPMAQSSVRAAAELVPVELGQVARSLGLAPFSAFRRAILPNLLPGIGAALALSSLELMRELTATLLLAPAGTSTLATEFWNDASNGAYGEAAPFAAVLVLISGLPVAVFTMRALWQADAP